MEYFAILRSAIFKIIAHISGTININWCDCTAMNNENIIWEYWDCELKNQSKKRLAMLEKAVIETGAVIVDRDESQYFKDKLKWRNPLLLKIKLPKGKRWEFILASKCWLSKPPQIQLGLQQWVSSDPPRIPLRGNHDHLKTRRRYRLRLHPENVAYIADYRPELKGGYKVFEGAGIVAAVLNGDLDLIL